MGLVGGNEVSFAYRSPKRQTGDLGREKSSSAGSWAEARQSEHES